MATAGSPVRATSNESDPAARFGAHSILFQRNDPTETGRVYIVDRSDAQIPNHVLAVLGAPTANIFPSFSITVTYAPAAFNVADYWIDAENNGEGCVVSAIRA